MDINSTTMDDDGDDKDDTKRKSRNRSEKKRRDQFNLLINELSALISPNNRKMDKSTVLKSTISFLKNHNEVTVQSRAYDICEEWKPSFLLNEEFTYLILEALEGFVMVFSASGRIYYVSESVTALLGYNPSDIINKNVFDLAFDQDRPQLYGFLQNPTTAVKSMQDVAMQENNVIFRCHIKRGSLDFRDEDIYELIEFKGYFRNNSELVDINDSTGYEHDMRLLFICTARLCTPQLIRDASLVDSSRREFTSRHSLRNFHFLFLDHRASPIIGYLPLEVLGTSGYDYYHFDDLEKVITCHQALMQKGELTSCYRFLTKSQQWIWLQTRFYLTYHQWNSKPEFVVCTHKVLSYSDLCKSMKRAIIESDSQTDGTATSQSGSEQRNESTIRTVSPSYASENSDAMPTTYQSSSQPASVKSASGGSTVGTVITMGTPATPVHSWSRARQHYGGDLDTASTSEGSTPSQGGISRNVNNDKLAGVESQHGMGAQYLDPAPYVSAVQLQGVSPVPMDQQLIMQDQAQLQLQKKHEELQEMLVRQQEELRHVKEQLLLARLGLLPPLNLNAQNQLLSPEDLLQNNQFLTPQVVYQPIASAEYSHDAQEPNTQQ